MKVSVITPTYNDSESIEETLKSLLEQTYNEWEWIIVNDGSTDDTEDRLKTLIKKYNIAEKCIYIYQENRDQLNAILNALQYVTGKYLFVLHSDDLLPGETFFEQSVEMLEHNSDIDGIYGDCLVIDEESSVVGRISVDEYRMGKQTLALMLLWLGRNLYSDVAFHRASIYKKSIKENYLKWNMPLWVDIKDNQINMLNYKTVAYPVLKYRVHGANYINNELGKMNVINGELRTASQLMHFFTIPHYKRQYILYRAMNKIKLNKKFRVKFEEKETKNKYAIVSFIIKKRYPNGIGDNVLLASILGFYQANSERILVVPKVPKRLKIYYGKDIKMFNKKMVEHTLEPFYIKFMEEMKKGFSCIIAEDADDQQILKEVVKFMCVGHVEVRKK